MTLPDTIGGHSREALLAVLPFENDLPKCPCKAPMCQAEVALHDHAKLAELMASALRERDLGVWYGKLLTREKYPLVVVTHGRAEIFIRIALSRAELGNYSTVATLSIPAARAALLRVLQLPEGATAADAMKALGVGK